MPDCAGCADQCAPFMLDNGVCDDACNVLACGYD